MHHDTFDIARNVLSQLGLNLEDGNTHITIDRGYEFDDVEGFYYTSITVHTDMKKLNAEQRKALKEFATLEVPEWAKDSMWKPLQGQRTVVPRTPEGQWEVRVLLDVSGAFECRAIDIDNPPSDTAIELADTYERMTPEEALAHMKARAEELRKPTRGTKWSCAPNKFEE